MHASCESPWHCSAKHHILGACFSLMAPFRTRFSPCKMAYIAYVQRLIGRLYALWYCYIPTCRFTAQPAFVYAQAHQRAIGVEHSPVPCLAVACNAHGVIPPILTLPGWAGQGVAYPALSSLLALAPTLGRFMRPPGAVLAIAELHLHAMLATPAFRWCLLAFRFLLRGEALEQRFQPCQQALFVTIPQGHLHH